MRAAREFLKEHTKAAHQQLDETVMVKGLAAGTLAPRTYRTMLGGYYAFFSPFEREMQASHPEIVTALGAFRFGKTHWLEEDLLKLGGSFPEPPSLAPFPLPDDPAGLAGCIYVVEGSTLGGMHLSRAGKFPESAGRFFRGYGDGTMPAWKEFVAWLDATVLSEGEKVRAAETAAAVFAWFQATFTALAEGLEQP